MDPFTHGTVRACCLQLLTTATGPLTAANIADRINTTPTQAQRALRQLEDAGRAVRERGKPWASPDRWRATESQPAPSAQPSDRP
jgi:predicted ArsR family transcriptional regulator